jgi:Zn-dependent protease
MTLDSLTWRFTALRMPVQVHPFFWLLAILFGSSWSAGAPDVREGWLRTFVGAALVFVGVLVHELGHALAGRKLGRTPSIVLHGWGGVTSWQSGGPRLTVGQHVWISFAGPFVGIVLGGGVLLLQTYVLPPVSPFVAWALDAFVFVNLGWALFNLLPVLPLDGARIAQAVAIHRWAHRGNVGIHRLSLGVAVALVLVGLVLGRIFLVLMFGFLAHRTWQQLQLLAASDPVPSRSRRDDDRPRRWLN